MKKWRRSLSQDLAIVSSHPFSRPLSVASELYVRTHRTGKLQRVRGVGEGGGPQLCVVVVMGKPVDRQPRFQIEYHL